MCTSFRPFPQPYLGDKRNVFVKSAIEVFESDLGWFALKETMLKAIFDLDEQEESNSAR